MNRPMLYRSILRNLLRQKFKSLLMTLGVLVGVFTLTAGMALGSGFKLSVLNYFNNIFLPNSLTLGTDYDIANASGIRKSDMEAIVNDIAGVTAWSPLLPGGRQTLVRAGRAQITNLFGVSENGGVVTGQIAEIGDYFGTEDIRSRARVVLLGQTVRKALFGDESPVGQSLTIGTQVYVVKGVLSKLGGDPHGGDLDNLIRIPYTTLQQINKGEDLVNVRLRLQDAAAVTQAARQIPLLLRQRHQIVAGQQDDFFVATAPAGQAAFRQFQQIFELLLPIVVGVILLTGALVIASMMLIAVKERGAEIGLRKAVGARAQDVEHQFLVETLLLTTLGGVLGIALSYPLMFYVQDIYAPYDTGISFLPTPLMLVVSVSSATLTGVLAAWLPARQAAALNPLATLR
jgi:putative ABC transport system permease protein